MYQKALCKRNVRNIGLIFSVIAVLTYFFAPLAGSLPSYNGTPLCETQAMMKDMVGGGAMHAHEHAHAQHQNKEIPDKPSHGKKPCSFCIARTASTASQVSGLWLTNNVGRDERPVYALDGVYIPLLFSSSQSQRGPPSAS